MKRIVLALAALCAIVAVARQAHSQPVPVTWRPPVTCSTNDFLKWSGTAWVCSGGAAATITGSANVVIKSNGSGSGVASLWSDDGTTTAYNTNKFTIASASGNTAVAGTLAVNGNTTLGDAISDTATVNGNTTITGATSGAVLNLIDATQATERLRLSGQEFYQPSNTDTNGPTFLLGYNRSGVRQVWLADSATLTQNSTNVVLRLITGNTAGAIIDAIATDGITAKTLTLGNSGGLAKIAGTFESVGAATMDSTLAVLGSTGIGVAPASERLSVSSTVGATFSIANNSDIGMYDATSMAQGVGGGIEFMGNYTGTSSTQAALIKAMKSTGKDNAWDFDLAFGTRRDQSGDITKRLVIEAGGTTSALGGLVGVKGTAASMFGADVSDIFYSGFIRKNLSKYSHAVGTNVAADGNWRVVTSGNTLAYATTTDSASPYGYDFTDTVGQITCTDGGTLCSAGGSDYRYIATSATTGIADLRSKTITLSVWVKAASGTNTGFKLSLARYSDNDLGNTTCTVNSTTWTRCSLTRTFNSSSLTDNSELRAYLQPFSTTAHEIAGVQIELGSDPTLLEETDGTIGPGAYAYSSASAPAYSVGTAYDYAIGAWAYTLGVGNTAQNPTFQVGFNGDAYGHSLTSLQTSGLDASTSFAGDRFTIVGSISGSSDATAAARANYGGYFTSDATRSAGGNAVTNYGIYTEASGAQTNYAIYADLGNTYLGATSGTVGIGTAPTSDKLTIGGKTTITLGSTLASASPAGTGLELTQSAGSSLYLTFRQTDATNGIVFANGFSSSDGGLFYNISNTRSMAMSTAGTIREYIGNDGTIHIGTTTNTASTAVALEVGGQVQATGTDPALSSCGTSPTIVGSDLAGIVTIGSGTATSCTVTFASTYTAEPACVLTPQSTTGASWSFSAKSATAFTVTSSGGSNLAGLKFNYHCFKM